MSLAHAASGDPYDSARDLMAAWDPTFDEEGPGSLTAPLPRGSSGDPLDLPLDPQSRAVDDSYPIGPTVLQQAFGPPLQGGESGESREQGGHADAAAGDKSPCRPALPKAGETLGGFRLVVELGRGAFARVFLAEEMSLGQRLVALKVSRAEGDEPRILARLQHAHIVPVHSVHDDPATGLRLLCMPFFGGANLAQLLQEAWGLSQAQATGRSLVEALDQFSQRLPALAGRESLSSPGSYRRSRLRSRAALEGAADGPPSLTPETLPATGDAANSLWRIRTLVNRLVPRREPAGRRDDLDEALPSRRFLREADAIRASVWIVARLAEGLDHAHGRGLLHRDLKPANILIAADGTPMLLDFNLAAETEPRAEACEEGISRAMIGGTLPYMSPEHLDAFDPEGSTLPEAVDERSDLYAMGLILFELIAGSHPFSTPSDGPAPIETIRAMIAERRRTPAPSLRDRCPAVPWSLDALVAQCLQPDPAKRYAYAADLADDLRRFLDDLPMKHCPDPSVKERLGKWARRHPGLSGSTSVALVSLVLLGLLGGAAAYVYDAMLGVASRVKLQQFDREFVDAQFLLNVADDRGDWTRRGLSRARKALDDLGLSNPGKAPLTVPVPPAATWLGRLAPHEQRRVRRQAVELVLLAARAEVRQAARRGSEEDRRRALERAVAGLNRAERLDHTAPAALYRDRARYHAALGEADLAVADRARAERQPPRDERDLTLLGTSLLASGDLPAAEVMLRSAIARDATSIWAWFALGHCHFEQGRYLEAAGDFSACVARGPDFAWNHFNRALALARAGRPFDALASYDRAVELAPDLLEARVDRGLAELELDEPERAAFDFRAAIDGGRKDLGVLAAYGESLARLGRTDEAEALFGDLLRKTPGDPVALVARGMTRLRTDPECAREDFAAVLLDHPRHAMAHYGMARVVRSQDRRAAIAHLDAALEADRHLLDALQLRALEKAHLGERSSLDDVELLLKAPTANRYYNAACALAVYSRQARDSGPLDRAMQLLELAVKAGFSPRSAAIDPDLEPLRTRPEFARLVEGSRP
jgi:serine/threonine protein kinase/tetratricopeptide (TPR) repeat protein